MWIKAIYRTFRSFIFRFVLPCSTVTGEPCDDTKGRWRVGGGINVPVNVTFKANKSQAKEIKRLLQQKKIQVILTSMDAE